MQPLQVARVASARQVHTTLARSLPVQRDRISSDGSWSSALSPLDKGSEGKQPYVIGSPVTPGETAPNLPPVPAATVDRLAELIQGARGTLVLTGAGCSTESGVPDYRGPAGAYTQATGFRPMTHQQFMASEENRKRYWARSFAGWPRFGGVAPNAAHEGIARLQHNGWVQGLITQNVDRLHKKAGSSRLLELHGTTHQVICMGCGRISCRHEFQQQLAALNPDAAAAAAQLTAARDAADDLQRMLRAGTAAAVHPTLREGSTASGGAGSHRSIIQRPDGDAEPVHRLPPPPPQQQQQQQQQQRPDGDMELVDGGREFRVPPCSACGGILKPDVVFFGDAITPGRAQEALDLAQSCRSMLVVGSSLAVWSAFRLAKAAVENGAQLAIVTAGPCRADDLAALKVEGRAGEVLARLAAHPSLQVPPVY